MVVVVVVYVVFEEDEVVEEVLELTLVTDEATLFGTHW